MTLDQIVNALQILRVACGTQSATYTNGTFSTKWGSMETLACFILLMIIATFWRAALRVLVIGAVLVGALCYYVQTLDTHPVQGVTQQ